MTDWRSVLMRPGVPIPTADRPTYLSEPLRLPRPGINPGGESTLGRLTGSLTDHVLDWPGTVDAAVVGQLMGWARSAEGSSNLLAGMRVGFVQWTRTTINGVLTRMAADAGLMLARNEGIAVHLVVGTSGRAERYLFREELGRGTVFLHELPRSRFGAVTPIRGDGEINVPVDFELSRIQEAAPLDLLITGAPLVNDGRRAIAWAEKAGVPVVAHLGLDRPMDPSAIPPALVELAAGDACVPGSQAEERLLEIAPQLSGLTVDTDRVGRSFNALLANRGLDYQAVAHPIVEVDYLDPVHKGPLDRQQIHAFREENGLTGKIAIPWLARPDPLKGFFFVMEAIGRRVMAGDEDLVIYCAQNPLQVDWTEDPLQEQTVELLSRRYLSRVDGRFHELGEHVRVVEKRPRSREARRIFLWAGDLFLAASVVESMGAAFIEELAAGLPGVALDAGALSDLIQHGRSGFVVPFTPEPDIARFAGYLGRLRNNAELRQRMGRAATQAMKSRFDQDTLTLRRERDYRRHIERGRRARTAA